MKKIVIAILLLSVYLQGCQTVKGVNDDRRSKEGD